MNELQIFENSEFGKVRVVEVNGEPMFVGKDVAEILGYTNPRKAIGDHVDDEDKGVTKCDTLGGVQDLTVINESGLYSLILSSKLPNAKQFKRWVTNEVLPSIRKHGMYAVDELVGNPDLLIKVATELKEERERRKELESTVQQMDAVITEMTPKADYADRILSSTDCMTVSQIAQDYGMSAKRFNRVLASANIQRRVGEQWILYASHQGKGYVRSKTCEYAKHDGSTGTKQLTVWTQKGRMFLYERLKNIGVLPEMEVANENAD